MDACPPVPDRRSPIRPSKVVPDRGPPAAAGDWDGVPRRAESHGLLPLAAMHLRGASGVPENPNTTAAARSSHRHKGPDDGGRPTVDQGGTGEGVYRCCTLQGGLPGRDRVRRCGPSQSSDIDLMVRKGDVLRARAILAALGFVGGPGPAVCGWLPAIQQRIDAPATAGRSHRRVAVGARTVVLRHTPGHRADVRQADASLVGGRPCRIRGHPGSWLIHGAKHLWERLIWVCDIVELVKARPNLDWDRVISTAREVKNRPHWSCGSQPSEMPPRRYPAPRQRFITRCATTLNGGCCPKDLGANPRA